MINRENALGIVKEHVKRKNLFKHILAVEAIMRELAKELDEDVELWSRVGLLHDVDFDETYDDPERHGLRSVEILRDELGNDISEEILHAIKSHNPEHTGVEPGNKMEYALIASDAISGLIVAATLVLPSKKLNDLEVENIKNRFKEKDFARNCNRDNMTYCEKIGLDKDEFFEISLNALRNISDELGL